MPCWPQASPDYWSPNAEIHVSRLWTVIHASSMRAPKDRVENWSLEIINHMQRSIMFNKRHIKNNVFMFRWYKKLIGSFGRKTFYFKTIFCYHPIEKIISKIVLQRKYKWPGKNVLSIYITLFTKNLMAKTPLKIVRF